MNIVTIKTKAQLAAMKLCSSRNDMGKTAEIIESCFTPDSANEINKDLIEALKALKACKEELHEIYQAALGPDESDAYREADRILDKYPNLI